MPGSRIHMHVKLQMICNFIKISVSPVKVELYDRPRALSRKLAKSFGCPGKKGRRTDRSMVLSVSVSVLEGKGRGGGCITWESLRSFTRQQWETHTGMCSTTNGSRRGAAWPAPAGGCPSACRWRPPAEASQHQESPNNFLPLRRKTRPLPVDESRSVLPFMELWRGAMTSIQLKTYEPPDRSSCLRLCRANRGWQEEAYKHTSFKRSFNGEWPAVLLTCMADYQVWTLNVIRYRTFEPISLQADVWAAVGSGKKWSFPHLKHQTLIATMF